MDEQFPIEEVPVELLKKIACFLTYRDALRFSHANKQMYELLSMSTIKFPSPVLSDMHWTGHFFNVDEVLPCKTIPILLKNRVHTVVLEGRWKDQGFGDRRGRIFVVSSSSVGTNRVVVQSGLAPHAEGPLQLEFNIHEDEHYHLWYCVGGGGGGSGRRSLHIIDLRIKLILFDERGRHLSKNFAIMEQRGALRHEQDFHFRMLQCVSRTLLHQMERGDVPDINMATFFESTGIDINRNSLMALDQIASSLIEHYKNDTLPSEIEQVFIQRHLFSSAVPAPAARAPAAHEPAPDGLDLDADAAGIVDVMSDDEGDDDLMVHFMQPQNPFDQPRF